MLIDLVTLDPELKARTAAILIATILAWGTPHVPPATAAPAPEGVRRPDRSRPGPWDNDVVVYRVDANGQSEKLATFERAGVSTAARLKDGRLIVAHQHFPENNDAAFDKVAVRFSTDEGRTWSGPRVIQLTGLPEGMRFPFDPTLVPLPDGRVRLYYTSVRGRTFQDDRPAIYSAVSSDGVDFVVEPGTRFGVEGRLVIDCAVALHHGVFHLVAPDNGAADSPHPPGERRPRDQDPAQDGLGYHAISTNGLDFVRQPDARVAGRRRWLGNLQSNGEVLRMFGTGEAGRPGRPGGVWSATSTDGQSWVLDREFESVPGADPGAVKLQDGGWLLTVTGPPRNRTGALRFWPQWRGPLANGVAPTADPPLRWSEQDNVRWKIPLPGKGHSSPIIYGDRVFLTAAVPQGERQEPVYDNAPGTHDNLPVTHRHQFVVLAVNRADGNVAWKRIVREEFPHEGGHVTGSLASNSPVTDGERLYAFFGSRGLYCLDPAGEVVWEKDLGRMQTLHAHGEGSSPVLHRDTLIVCWDHEGDSFLYALDKHTGAQRWKVARDEETSWSTPLVVEHEGGPQVVVSATRRVCGYDLRTGALLWQCAGLSRNVVSSPVAGHGMVFAGNSYDWQAMLAIRLAGARGDITDTPHLAWKLNRLTPYVSSPLLYDDTLYFLRHNQNVLSRLHPVSGEPRGEPLRLDGIRDFIFASPVGAAGRLYITARDGVTVVLHHDRDNAPLALNRLDDVFSASPALVDRELYLRGEKYLYCIAEVETGQASP